MSKDRGSNNMADHEPQGRPVIRIVRGMPTDDELAALIGALRVRHRDRAAAAATASARTTPSAWVRSARPGTTAGGLPVRRGPLAWRASALPG